MSERFTSVESMNDQVKTDQIVLLWHYHTSIAPFVDSICLFNIHNLLRPGVRWRNKYSDGVILKKKEALKKIKSHFPLTVFIVVNNTMGLIGELISYLKEATADTKHRNSFTDRFGQFFQIFGWWLLSFYWDPQIWFW